MEPQPPMDIAELEDDEPDEEPQANPALEIEETEAPEDSAPETLRFEISSYPADYTVKGLVEKWEREELVLPDFQRGYVWKMPKASKLVESFLIGLPVPQIFLYKDRRTNKLKVIDGHQRLASLARFYSEMFDDRRAFRLRGVHPRWEGKRYSDLDERDRLQLDDATMRSIVVQQLSPDDHESIYLIFERLNAGGVNLMPMEIRKSVFHGQAYAVLDGLNGNADWRRLIGQPLPDDRLRDVELVLRVLALSAGWRNYTKPMKTFITKYMESLSELDEARLDEIALAFAAACAIASRALGDRPFHLRGRLNVAALDSVLGGIIATGVTDADVVARAYAELKADAGWVEAVSISTSDASVIETRFTAVVGLLTAG